MSIRIASLTVFLIAITECFAQVAPVTVLPGATASGFGRAPQGSRQFINTMYILTPSEMAAAGVDGQEIFSVGWRYSAGTPQDVATTGTLKLYLQNTTDVTYEKGLTFDTQGMTKVIDTTIDIPAGGGPFVVDVPLGGPGTVPFTSTAGQGLYIAFEYQTTSALATPLGSPTVAANNTLAASIGTYQSQTDNGTDMASSAFRPETRLGVHDVLRLVELYAEGYVCTPRDTAQRVEVLIENVDTEPHTVPVTVRVLLQGSGTVKWEHVEDVSIPAGSTILYESPYYPTIAASADSIVVDIGLVGDELARNNTKSYGQFIHYLFFGIADPTKPHDNGVGFTSGQGQFLQRHHIQGCEFVLGASIYLTGQTSVGNTVRGVLYNANGQFVSQSNPLVIQESHLDNYFFFGFSFTPMFVNEDVYIGLAVEAPIGGGYNPLGSQLESPLRPDTWYFRSGVAFNSTASFSPWPAHLGRPMIFPRYSVTRSTQHTIEGGGVYCEGEQVTLTAVATVLPPTQLVGWRIGACDGPSVPGSGSGAHQITFEPPLGTTTYFARVAEPCGTILCASVEVTVLPADQDTDEDGIPDCLDSCPLVFGEVGDPCDDGDPDTVDDVLTEDCECEGVAVAGVAIALRAMLEGPFDQGTGLMRDDLREAGLIPLAEPYTTLGYTHVNDLSGAIDPAILATTGDDAIVDWVMVELRSATDPTVVVATRSALIQRNGDIVDTDGTSPLNLQAAADEYHMLVRHRNHLACMTLDAIPLDGTPQVVDLTDPLTETFGTEAQKEVNGVALLWAGDVRANGALRYVGEDNDRDAILVAIGGTVPSAEAFGYLGEDVNMDGVARYVGFGNDRDPILVNIGSLVPSNIRVEQVP